jgi:hypothetical protein
MMRRLLVVGGAVAVCLAIAATVAFAAANTVTYDSKLSPSHPKAKPGKPANVGYEGILSVGTSDNKQPDTAPTTVIYFPKQLQNNAKKFPSPCKVSEIDGKPTIPAKCKAAQVGTGTASSFAGVPGQAPTLTEQLTVKAYNAAKGKQLLLVLNTTPNQAVPITNRVIVGALGSGSGAFGYKVTFKVPQDLQNAGLQIALTHFDVKISKSKTVKVKGKRITYLQLKSCPSSKKLPTKTTANFDNSAGGAAVPPAGPPITVTGTMGC